MKRNRAFTLVELAIVIVIAGILAAVAIPIYNGIIEKSKWTEGKSNASLIQAAIKVEVAEESGNQPAQLIDGAIPWVWLALNSTDYDGADIQSADYGLNGCAVAGTNPATWIINVTPGDGAPTGSYLLDQSGDSSSSTCP